MKHKIEMLIEQAREALNRAPGPRERAMYEGKIAAYMVVLKLNDEQGESRAIELEAGWKVNALVDSDGHLNVYVENTDGSDIFEVDTGQGDGKNAGQSAVRFSTAAIEEEHNVES